MKPTHFRPLSPRFGALIALIAFIQPTYAQLEECHQPLKTAADCRLTGPVQTVEAWCDFPDTGRRRRPANKVAPAHNFLAFSRQGVVTGGGVDNNGDLKLEWRYVQDESQRSVTLDQAKATSSNQADFRAHRLFFYDPQGHLILMQDAAPDGTLQDVEKFLYDGVGDELWEEDYAQGRRYDRIDLTYDDQGRLIRETHFDRGYMEYHYQSPNRRIAVYFPPDDPGQPQTAKPKLTLETTFDGGGRPLDETTIGAPLEVYTGVRWPYEYLASDGYEYRLSGRVTKTYDAQGRVLKQTNFSPSGKIDFAETNEYDNDGNIISQTIGGDDYAATHRFQFAYEFDAQGNWIQKTQYALYSDGTREIVEIDYRRLAYY
ncbi:MAG TPA: hypothetical protein VIY69_11090 [Candidatus Acidoferrales bacterium]